MTKETEIKHQIKDYLNAKGIFWWYELAGIGAYKGIPDLFAIRNGVTYAIEVKTPKGRQSPHQRAFQANYEGSGGKYILAKGYEDIEPFFK